MYYGRSCLSAVRLGGLQIFNMTGDCEMKLFGKKSVEEVLDATGRDWEMSSMPGRRDKRYEVKIAAYFDEKNKQFKVLSFVGVGATFNEAAEKALRLAGLLKRDRWPKIRRTVDFVPRDNPSWGGLSRGRV